ncbi:MAG TPA: VanZ family protein [Myxococcales bacterium]|jgi:VanZ family protein
MTGGRLGRVAWHWLPLAAYAGTIFALSSMSHPPVPSVDLPHFDKVLHFCEYAGFGLLLCRALTMGGQGLSPRAAFGAALLLGALYGASDEVHQMFVPHREADVFDLLADVLGAASGAGLFALGSSRRARRTT